jgi:hypothetical protein
VNPLITVWTTFKPNLFDDLMTKGLLENQKFIEAKFEETKNLVKD